MPELDDLVHTDGRLHARDLVGDAPGQAFDSAAPERHSMEVHTEATRPEADSFAWRLTGRVEAARVQGDVDAIGPAAPPRLRGMLRESLDREIRRLVDVEIDKNLLGVDPEEIARQIREANR